MRASLRFGLLGGSVSQRSSGIAGLSCPLVALLVAAGCRPAASEPRCTAGPHEAAVRVVVNDAESGVPLPRVDVTVFPWGDRTTERGVACVSKLSPEKQHVYAERVGFFPETTSVHLAAGHVTELALALQREPPPCCRLHGVWWVRLDLTSAGRLAPHPTARTVNGWLVFDPKIPNPVGEGLELQDSIVQYEFGRHALDLRPFFGAPYGRDVSTTVVGGGPSLYYEVLGLIETRDTVSIGVIPRMSHGGLSLWGHIRGDTISGRWRQNAYCCGAEGTFVMSRRPWSRESDSLVALAIRQDSVQRRAGEVAFEAWQKTLGQLRLRTYDEATRRYVEADYWLIRQKTATSTYLATTLSSDSSGWSGYRGLEPGTWSVELFTYPCGDLTYFADTVYVREHLAMTVIVRTGVKTERDVRINSRSIRADTSYENKDGRSCQH